MIQQFTHLALASVFAFGLYYDIFLLQFPDAIKFRYSDNFGRLKYLTFWNMIIITTFYVVSSINDILGTQKENVLKRNVLQKTLDTFFSAIVFPSSLAVFFLFWGLYFFNRELIFPRIFETFFPAWLNHIVHTLIGFAVVLEEAIVHHFYPKRKTGIIGMYAYFGIYLLWIYYIFYTLGFWPYPFLEKLNAFQHLIFYGVCAAVLFLFYLMGELMCKTVWAKQIRQRKTKAKKRSS